MDMKVVRRVTPPARGWPSADRPPSRVGWHASPTQELIRSEHALPPTFDLVIAANRLPVDRVVGPDGESTWRRSPGGLVTAMESVMRGREGAWVGWAGEAGEAPEPFDAGQHVPAPGAAVRGRGRASTTRASATTPCGRSTTTSSSRRRSTATGGDTYRDVNRRFAEAVAEVAAPGAHGVGARLPAAAGAGDGARAAPGRAHRLVQPHPLPAGRAVRPAARGGAPLLEGLLGADFLGFQRTADAENFLRACRRLLGMTTKGDTVVFTPHGSGAQERTVRASAIPISVDFRGLDAARRSPEVIAAGQGDPRVAGQPAGPHARRRPARLHQGHPAPAQGLRGAAARQGRSRRRTSMLVQVATPSRERVEAYRELRQRGRDDGRPDQRRVLATSASPAVQYLHHCYPRRRWRRCSSPPTSCS